MVARRPCARRWRSVSASGPTSSSSATADELIALVAAAAFEPGDEVIVPEPSFEPYTIGATLAGARRPEPARPVRHRPGRRAPQGDRPHEGGDALYAAQSGDDHHPAPALIAFLEALGPDAPSSCWTRRIRDFCDDPDSPDGIALLARYPRLIVLRTFSKIAGLAGLRVGYAVADAAAIDRLNRVRAPTT